MLLEITKSLSRMNKKLVVILFILFSYMLEASPLSTVGWSEAAIKDSYKKISTIGNTAQRFILAFDPNKLVLIFESDNRHFMLIDSEKLILVYRSSLKSPLQDKPLLGFKGRYVYFISKDGWVNKFDKKTLGVVEKIRVGLTSSSISISSDNKYLMVGNTMPKTLVTLNTNDLSLVKVIPVIDKKGKTSSVFAVRDAPSFKSFIVSLKDSPEIWQVNYQTPPPAGFGEWVHDYRKESGEAEIRLFPVRNIRLTQAVEDFFFDQEYVNVIGISQSGKGQVIDLDLGRKVAEISVSGFPYSSKGIFWKKGKKLLALANILDNSISIIDTKSWKIKTRVSILGPGLLSQSDGESPFIWISIFQGNNKGAIQVFDKRALKIIKTIQSTQNKSLTRIKFTSDNRNALVSTKSSIIVYDTTTLEEIKRIPIKDIKEKQ